MIQFFTKKLRNRKGFTLVELMIVIAVLGILAAIAVPRLTGVTDMAREQADETTAQSILTDARVAVMSGDLTAGDDLDDLYDVANGGVAPDPQSSTADFVLVIAADATTPNRFTITVTLDGTTLATDSAEALQ